MAQNPLLLYLEDSDDGLCAAWIYARHVASGQCDVLALQRTDDPPDVHDRDVVLFDFTYERAILQMMQRQAHSLTVIAHHVEDETNLFGLLGELYYDPQKSAARQTWDRLVDPKLNKDYPHRVKIPWLVEYIDDIERRQGEKPHSAEVAAALSSYPRTNDPKFNTIFKTWDKIASRQPKELADEGAIIIRMRRIDFKKALDNKLLGYITVEPYGHITPCVCVNGGVLVEEIADTLAKDAAYGIGAGFYWLPGGTVHYHVRAHHRGISCERIAAHYEGRSFRNTADFVLAEPLEFLSYNPQ